MDDLKEGRWIREGGSMRTTTTTWHRGMLDGEAVFSDHQGKQIVATFDAGRLVNYDGQRVDDQTFDAIRTQTMDDQTAAALQQGTNIDFVEMPLKDAIRYIEQVHGIPIILDSRANFPLDVPVTATLSGLDLQSALAVITAPHGLACDYRYGLIWITKAEDVKNWRDPTGVADIRPPGGSSLSRAWNEPIVIDSVQLPLADVMTFLATKAAISIDSNRIDKTADGKPIMVNATIRGQPLKHALGHLLYNSGCCCELDGETLVIRPLERP